MGCGSSSLKGTEDVGTSDSTPAVPTNTNNIQPAGAAMKKVRTNFSTIDYEAPAETNKSSLLKARAPDELDEGPSRSVSYASPTTTTAAAPNDGIMEKAPATGAENKLEPHHTPDDGRDTAAQAQLGGKTADLVQ